MHIYISTCNIFHCIQIDVFNATESNPHLEDIAQGEQQPNESEQPMLSTIDEQKTAFGETVIIDHTGDSSSSNDDSMVQDSTNDKSVDSPTKKENEQLKKAREQLFNKLKAVEKARQTLSYLDKTSNAEENDEKLAAKVQVKKIKVFEEQIVDLRAKIKTIEDARNVRKEKKRKQMEKQLDDLDTKLQKISEKRKRKQAKQAKLAKLEATGKVKESGPGRD